MKPSEILEPEILKDLRIINLQAENVKRLIAVDIDFKDNLVQICSEDNEQGKTTTLDCIWWALEGAKNIQDRPIRKGQKEARITVTLIDGQQRTIVVTREFKINKKQELTTKLILSNPDGSEYITHLGAQELLNTFITSLAFDPLKFATMDSKAQFDAMRSFVPDIDFKAIAKANEADYELRKSINRDAKTARTQAEAIEVPDYAKDLTLTDEAKLIEELERASTFNADILERIANRKKLAQEAEDKFEESKKICIEAKQKIKELEEEIEKINKEAQEKSIALVKEVQEIKEKLAGLKPLPETIDIAVVSSAIKEARARNIVKNEYDKLQMYINTSDELEKQSNEITKRMEKREEDKKSAIASANIPIDNLTFGDECLLYNGEPFEQASEARKIYAGMQLAVAQNPLLKLVFIRQGSLMSEKTKMMVFEFAKKHDFTILMETVGTNSKIGNIVIIENGQVVKEPKKQEQI